jgi:hypothetical protein
MTRNARYVSGAVKAIAVFRSGARGARLIDVRNRYSTIYPAGAAFSCACCASASTAPTKKCFPVSTGLGRRAMPISSPDMRISALSRMSERTQPACVVATSSSRRSAVRIERLRRDRDVRAARASAGAAITRARVPTAGAKTGRRDQRLRPAFVHGARGVQ